MKARVKATGKLLEKVIPIMSVDNKVVMFHEYGTENEYYYYEDLDFSNTIDWEQVRIQAAIAAMQGLVSNEIHLNHADKVAEEKGINTSTFLAKCAIDIADALIEELRKGDVG